MNMGNAGASVTVRRQMLFPHDTEVALAATVALVNTSRDGKEELRDVAALERMLRAAGRTLGRPCGQPELDGMRRLRRLLAGFWEMSVDEAAARVNALLRDARALPQLVRHGGWDYHIHAVPPQAPLADQLAVEAAMAFADVIRSGQFDRLRICAAVDCDDVLVDLSKNRSRRFCGTACANRVNVAAYRTRRAMGAMGAELRP
jgi:predicted RNA-binding Zn ribbon-like protein